MMAVGRAFAGAVSVLVLAPVVRIIALRSDAGLSLYHYRFCVRRGLVWNQGMPHTIWLGDMNSDGVYSDLDSLLVIVDADRDGMPSIDYSIPEYFYPGFPLAGQVYDIEQVSPDGALLEGAVRDMSAHEPLPWVVVGEPGARLQP